MSRGFPDSFARLDPRRPAVVMAESGAVLGYAEMDAASNRIARVLRACGLRRGDHAAFLVENRPEFYELVWACERSGLYYTPVNTRLGVEEAAYIVADCGASVFIASARFAEVAEGVASATPPVGHRFSLGGEVPGFTPLEDAMSRHPAAPIDDESTGMRMVYSSGTTGRPKGIKKPLPVAPVGASDVWTDLQVRLYGFDASTVYLCPAPLYHSAGLWWSSLMHRLGGTVVLMERFDAEGFLRAVQEHRVTHTQVVPTMLVRLLKLPDAVRNRYDVSSLRILIHAAAPCPVEVKRRVIEWLGPIVHEYYAATEGIGSTHIDSAEWLRRPGSVGRPTMGIVHIVDDEGNECAPGEVGTVYFERSNPDLPPFEYHNDPARTAESRHPRGWATTGDMGRVDADGYLHLTDRKAFMIISGGVNIYPQEVENVLVLHPAVADAAVFGIPDEEWGEQVKAVVELTDGRIGDAALAGELIEFCRARLAHYKCPRSVDFIAQLPRQPNGKLYKRVLRDPYWERHASHIA